MREVDSLNWLRLGDPEVHTLCYHHSTIAGFVHTPLSWRWCLSTIFCEAVWTRNRYRQQQSDFTGLAWMCLAIYSSETILSSWRSSACSSGQWQSRSMHSANQWSELSATTAEQVSCKAATVPCYYWKHLDFLGFVALISAKFEGRFFEPTLFNLATHRSTSYPTIGLLIFCE